MATEKAAALPPLSGTLLPAETDDVLEPDELWSLVDSHASRPGITILTNHGF